MGRGCRLLLIHLTDHVPQATFVTGWAFNFNNHGQLKSRIQAAPHHPTGQRDQSYLLGLHSWIRVFDKSESMGADNKG